MNHSNIVKDLLHKLSKNEFLAQDGGYQTYSNKANQYRNQLNSLYGAGRGEDDAIVDEINRDIEQLIPVSLLQEYAAEAQKRVDALLAEQATLEQKIAQLEQSAASGNQSAEETIKKLQQELQGIQTQMTQLQAVLAQKETELQKTEEDLANLISKLNTIKTTTDNVKKATTMSPVVAGLFAQLRNAPVPQLGSINRPTSSANPSAPTPSRVSSQVSANPSSVSSSASANLTRTASSPSSRGSSQSTKP
jgi:chromosome segregation ATPase